MWWSIKGQDRYEDKEGSKIFDKQKKNIDIVVIISSDGGYADIVNEAREFKKKVVVIGEEKTPNVLRESCSSFVEL